MIHEYTHFPPLVSPLLPSGAEDHWYGRSTYVYYASVLAGPKIFLAAENADSYFLFAREVFWTYTCGMSFADPPPVYWYDFSIYCGYYEVTGILNKFNMEYPPLFPALVGDESTDGGNRQRLPAWLKCLFQGLLCFKK